jgi:phosphonate transport system ATP-binding protein
MIAIRNLSKNYPDGTVALRDATLDMPRGEFLVRLGRSGAEKSTLLRCLSRLIAPTSGSITIDGTQVEKLRGRALRNMRRRVGMIFQKFHLIKRKRVIDTLLSDGQDTNGACLRH